MILCYNLIMKIRYCTKCGSEKYYCKGLCHSCYAKSLIPKNWSKNFDKCIICSNTNRPHVGHGYCTFCYQNRKSEVLCACGCGEFTVLRGNKPKKFLQGHWLHTQSTDSLFHKNQAKAMLGSSNPQFGKFGKNHPAYGHHTTNKTRQERRERRLNALMSKGKTTNIEIILSDLLDCMNLSHTSQTILHNKFTVDEFIPKYNLVIEANGGYWHGDYRKHLKLNKTQKTNRSRDKSKYAYLNACGHRVLVLWEKELLSNPEWCKQEIILAIENSFIPLLQDSVQGEPFSS